MPSKHTFGALCCDVITAALTGIYFRAAEMDLDDLPYRCPKCGDSETFPTLRHLRDHLETKHSYQSPWKKKKLGFGRFSPLSESFNKETEELEKQLQLAKEAEQRHKEQWQQLKKPFVVTVGSKNPEKAVQCDNKTNLHATMPPQSIAHIPFLHVDNPTHSHIPFSNQYNGVTFDDGYHPTGVSHKDYGTNDALENRYNKNSVPLRNNNAPVDVAFYDMLTKATEQIINLRQSSDHLLAGQKTEIDRLRHELYMKDDQLSRANKELVTLTDDRVKMQREMLELEKKQDSSKEMLTQRHTEIKLKDDLIAVKQQ